MELTKFRIVGFVLFAMTSGGDAGIELSRPDEESTRIFEDLAQILTSCYGDRIRGVGLIGTSFDTLARTLSTQHMIPVVQFDATPFNPERVRRPDLQFRQKLQIFVIDASISDHLLSTIQQNVLPTIWWNNMASFYILSREPRCEAAIELLHILWVLNVLDAKVICNHFYYGRRLILTFNPYTIHAPAMWQRVAVFQTRNNHPFTVFYRLYEGDESICVDFDFEKANDLGGYEISIEGHPLPSEVTEVTMAQDNLDRYWSTMHRVFHNIFRSLNATPKIMTIGRPEDLLAADMKQIGWLMLYVWHKDKATYPYRTTGFIIVSQFRGHKSQLEKILCVIDFYSRCGMGVVYLLTLIFFLLIVRQSLVPAVLNLVRMTCDTGFSNIPNNNATRIYLTCLLFFIVTMQGIYQGNLASLLTTVIPVRNVEGMQDLVDLDYTVYANDFIKSVVEQYPELMKRLVMVNDVGECVAHVVNDPSAACIRNVQSVAVDLARKYELHSSDQFVATFYCVIIIRWDWPPEDQVNAILSRMFEADVILPWHIKCAPLDLSDLKYDKEVRSNQIVKKIELAELTFAFVILGIGLVCATLIFIVEVAISPT